MDNWNNFILRRMTIKAKNQLFRWSIWSKGSWPFTGLGAFYFFQFKNQKGHSDLVNYIVWFFSFFVTKTDDMNIIRNYNTASCIGLDWWKKWIWYITRFITSSPSWTRRVIFFIYHIQREKPEDRSAVFAAEPQLLNSLTRCPGNGYANHKDARMSTTIIIIILDALDYPNRWYGPHVLISSRYRANVQIRYLNWKFYSKNSTCVRIGRTRGATRVGRPVRLPHVPRSQRAAAAEDPSGESLAGR